MKMPMRLSCEPRDSASYLKGYCDAKLDYEVRHAKRIVVCHEGNSYSYVCEACETPVDSCDNFCRGCGAKLDGR